MLRWLVAGSLLLGACGCGQAAPPPPVPADAESVASFDAIEPSGQFKVGMRSLSIEQIGRIVIYYPAVPEPASDVVVAPTAPAERLSRRFGAEAAADLAVAHGYAREGLDPVNSLMPLVIFMPGAGLGSVDYRLLMSELASRGIIVAGLAPEGSPPANEDRYGEAMAELAKAMTALAQPAALGDGLIVDPNRIALVGHSLGGAAAVAALADEGGAKLAVNVDGDFAGAAKGRAADRAILLLFGKHLDEPARSRQRRSDDIAEVIGNNGMAEYQAIAGMRHFDIMDVAALPTRRIAKAIEEGRISGSAMNARLVRRVADFVQAGLSESKNMN